MNTHATFLVVTCCWALLLAQPAAAQGLAWDKLNQEMMSLYLQGKYDSAVAIGKKALGLAEHWFRPDHPHVTTSLNNLGELYKAQGQYAAAELLYNRSLAVREKALGPDHPDLATSLNDLATLYRTQGQYAAAEPLFKRSLAISEKALGPDHPDVATVLENMAILYERMKTPEVAKRYSDRAEQIRRVKR